MRSPNQMLTRYLSTMRSPKVVDQISVKISLGFHGVCGSVFALLLCLGALLSLEHLFPGVVQLQFDQLDVAGVNRSGHLLSVCLLLLDRVNVDAILEPVDIVDLSSSSLVASPDHHHFILLPDREGAHTVFVLQLLRQGRTHYVVPGVGGCREVGFPGLPSGG